VPFVDAEGRRIDVILLDRGPSSGNHRVRRKLVDGVHVHEPVSTEEA
jgi:hypothetical protein